MEMSDSLQVTTNTLGVKQGCSSDYTAPTFGAFDGNLYLNVQEDITFSGANDGDCSFSYTFTIVCNFSCGVST